jgi:NADH:ubiquinone oxidoreductase subunit
MYPWPIGNFDYVMDDALHIALDYLDRTGRAVMFQEVQSTAANAIVAAWKSGVRHRIKLADIAIKAVERKAEPLEYKRG